MTSRMYDWTLLPPAETGALTTLLAAMRHTPSEGAALVGLDDTRWELPAEAYRVLTEGTKTMIVAYFQRNAR